MIQVFSKKELARFKEIGLDFSKPTINKKQKSNNDEFINDFLPIFRPNKKSIKSKDNKLKLTKKQIEGSKLLSTKTESFLYGGGRSGKTTLIALKLIFESIYNKAKILCIRENFSDIKDSLDKTFEHIVTTYNLNCKVTHTSPIYYKFPEGGEITLKGIQGSSKKITNDKKLGSEYSIIYFNEASQIAFSTFKTLKTRLNKPKVKNDKDLLPTQIIVDCNPPSKNHWLYSYFIKNENPKTEAKLSERLVKKIGIIRMNPIDNIENIQEDYIEGITDMGGETYKRFVEGEFSNNDDLSIFKENYFKYVDNNFNLDNMQFEELVIGVDPAVKSGEQNDETGIVVCALKKENDNFYFYVLNDFSGRMTTDTWLAKVINLYNSFNYDKVKNKKTIVIETNQGGDLLKNSLRDVNKGTMPNIFEVHSKDSKFDRALLVSRLYEKGAVYHLKNFEKLQGQMNSLGADEFLENDDRVDVLVHALTYLFNKTQKPKSMLSQYHKLIF